MMNMTDPHALELVDNKAVEDTAIAYVIEYERRIGRVALTPVIVALRLTFRAMGDWSR